MPVVRRTLRKSEILRGRTAFRQVFAGGKRFRSRHLKCMALAGSGNGVMFGVAVSSAAGNASSRNRIKRQIRDAYRAHKYILIEQLTLRDRSVKLIFVWDSRRKIPRPGVTYQVLEQEVVELLTEISGS